MGYSAMFPVEIQPTVQLNISCYLLHISSSFVLFFDPEDGGDMFLQNVGCLTKSIRRHSTGDETPHNNCCQSLKYY
jgi:hypothetical protein